jgi:hypothetical protein
MVAIPIKPAGKGFRTLGRGYVSQLNVLSIDDLIPPEADDEEHQARAADEVGDRVHVHWPPCHITQ